MTNFDSWLNTDSQYDANELAQCVIDDRINVLIKTTFKPANLVNEAVAEFTVKENQQVADYVNENDMTGLGNFIYLKTYDFAYELATKQAEHEFNNGELK